jgi:hypothetical protein
MSKFARPLLFGILMTFAASCGGGDSSSSSTSDNCTKNCAISAMLKCPKDNAATCQSTCEQTAAAVPMCRSQLDALLACSAARPASDWECDSDGEANVKGAFCNAEGLAAFSCVLGGGK